MSSRPDPSARVRLALDDGDRAAAAGEVQRRGQPGQSGADDDDAVGACLRSASHHAARSVQAAAMSARAVRTSRSDVDGRRPGVRRV